MKAIFTKVLTGITLAVSGYANTAMAQAALFKDLTPGTASSQPDQFMNVNGTMYFHTNSNYVHALWKSDGTAANTVLVKDQIITSSTGLVVNLRGSISNTLYYSVNSMGSSAGDSTSLWKTDGTAPVLVAGMKHPGYPGFGGGYPTQFTVAGNKMFFTMWKDHGRELWVSDGTSAGTKEVIDLNPGNNGGGLEYSGVADVPMAGFNGKVYFTGGTTNGATDLYTSDGTAAGTAILKAGVTDPANFIIYKNELYFGANGGELWKTDGTSGGTVMIANTGFAQAVIFKNQLFYSIANKLWKSDGTTAGTVAVKDSVGSIVGANNDYLFTNFFKSLSTPPYYEYVYWRSDGTTAGTAKTTKYMGSRASFNVLNNKMYTAVADSGTGIYTSTLWETDGTGPGNKVVTGYLSYPYIYNNAVFFSNHESASGYELWSYGGGATAIASATGNATQNIYPNPSNDGMFNVLLNNVSNASLTVSNLLGETVHSEKVSGDIHRLDLSHLSAGIYLLQIAEGSKVNTCKIVIQK